LESICNLKNELIMLNSLHRLRHFFQFKLDLHRTKHVVNPISNPVKKMFNFSNLILHTFTRKGSNYKRLDIEILFWSCHAFGKVTDDMSRSI
jgi:hypothetical protein